MENNANDKTPGIRSRKENENPSVNLIGVLMVNQSSQSTNVDM